MHFFYCSGFSAQHAGAPRKKRNINQSHFAPRLPAPTLPLNPLFRTKSSASAPPFLPIPLPTRFGYSFLIPLWSVGRSCQPASNSPVQLPPTSLAILRSNMKWASAKADTVSGWFTLTGKHSMMHANDSNESPNQALQRTAPGCHSLCCPPRRPAHH